MKTALIVAAAVATTVLTAPAYAADIVCSIHDTVGNNLTYAFGGNSTNANGTFGGTMVESGFEGTARRPSLRSGGVRSGFSAATRSAGLICTRAPRRAGQSPSAPAAARY